MEIAIANSKPVCHMQNFGHPMMESKTKPFHSVKFDAKYIAAKSRQIIICLRSAPIYLYNSDIWGVELISPTGASLSTDANIRPNQAILTFL